MERGATIQVPPPTPDRRSSSAVWYLQRATWISLKSAAVSRLKRPRWLQKPDTYAWAERWRKYARKRQKRAQAHHRQPTSPDGPPAQLSSSGTPPATEARQLGTLRAQGSGRSSARARPEDRCPRPRRCPRARRSRSSCAVRRRGFGRRDPGDPGRRLSSWSFSVKPATTTRATDGGRWPLPDHSAVVVYIDADRGLVREPAEHCGYFGVAAQPLAWLALTGPGTWALANHRAL